MNEVEKMNVLNFLKSERHNTTTIITIQQNEIIKGIDMSIVLEEGKIKLLQTNEQSK